MRVLLQRVKEACVTAEGRDVGRIGRGLLLLVGIGKDDIAADVERMAKKIVNMRIFEDEHGKMNLSIQQVNGAILSVPQFTLYADTRKGNRPGFEASAEPSVAEKQWRELGSLLRAAGVTVAEGAFGAPMAVSLVNDGPVTIWLDSNA